MAPVSVETYLGSFGTDLPSEPLVMVLAVCTLFYLIFHYDEIKNPAYKHPIVVLLLLMFCWSVFVTLFSTDVFLSIKYLLAKSWYLLGFFILPIILLRTKNSLKLFFWCLFIPTLLSVIFVMVRHGIMGFTFDTITNAVHPIYRNHVNYAVFITMLLPFIFLAKSWYTSNSLLHKLLKFSIPLFLAAIYLSYTRGAWLAVVVPGSLSVPVSIVPRIILQENAGYFVGILLPILWNPGRLNHRGVLQHNRYLFIR